MKIAKVKTVVLLTLCLAFFAVDAHAQIGARDVLDTVLARYQSAASGWAGVITARATWLFWTLVVISMVWTFGMMALRKADIGDFFAEFVRFTVFTGFFWWLLYNGPSFANGIISSLRQIGGTATGLGPALGPSGVVDVGFGIFYRVMDQSSVWSPVNSAVGIIMALVILVILALVGVNMLLLLVSGWILAYAGVFFLGFGGSRWTSDIAINYYKTVLVIAAELFVMVLIIGIGRTFLDDYYAHMTPTVSLKEMGVMLIVAVVLLMLVNKLPGLVAAIVTGTSIGHSGIGQFGAGAAVGAAGMAAAVAAMSGGMITAGAANAAGGAQAVMAALSSASQNVGSGSDVVTRLLGRGGESPGGDSSTGGTPFAEAAGFGGNIGPTSGGALASAGKAAKIAVDAGVNLARGAGRAAQTAAGERIARTTGGKIAATIKGQNPTFADNSLGGDEK